MKPVDLIIEGGKKGNEREESLLEGRLTVRTPYGVHALNRLSIEGAGGVPSQYTLSVCLPNALPLLALGRLDPARRLTFYHYDLFYTRQADEAAASNKIQNYQSVYESDLPAFDPAPDLILMALGTSGETELVHELIQQSYTRLAVGGKLVVSIDNPKDRWLRKQIESFFGGVTLQRKEEDGLVYLAKKKKSREIDANSKTDLSRFLRETIVEFAGLRLAFYTRPGVFCSDKLDEGSRALLETIGTPSPEDFALDLGCGWGAMSVILAKRFGVKRFTLIDSNARALELARQNWRRIVPDAAVSFRLESRAESILSPTSDESGQYDLVVTNPPYGTQYLASELFIQAAHKALRRGGRLALVTKDTQRLLRTVQKQFGGGERIERRGYSILTATRR